MFEIIEKEYKIDMYKIDSMFEAAMDTYSLNNDYAFAVYEAVDEEVSESIVTESTSKFIEKAKQVLQNIKDAIEKFIRNAKEAFVIQFKKMQFNRAVKVAKKYNGEVMKEFENRYNMKIDKSHRRNIKKTLMAMFKDQKDMAVILVKFQEKVKYAKTDDELTNIAEKYHQEVDEKMIDLEDSIKTYITSYPENGRNLIDDIEKEYGSVDSLISKMKCDFTDIIDSSVNYVDKIDSDEEILYPKKVSILKNISSKAASISTKCINAILSHPIMLAGAMTGVMAGVTVAVKSAHNINSNK